MKCWSGTHVKLLCARIVAVLPSLFGFFLSFVHIIFFILSFFLSLIVFVLVHMTCFIIFFKLFVRFFVVRMSCFAETALVRSVVSLPGVNTGSFAETALVWSVVSLTGCEHRQFCRDSACSVGGQPDWLWTQAVLQRQRLFGRWSAWLVVNTGSF